MHQWFPKYAEEVGAIWRSTIKFGAVTASMKDIGDESGVSQYDVKSVAEEQVVSLLDKNRGYHAIVAPKRKTPATVWAFLEYDHYVHVALFTIKFVFEGQQSIVNLESEKHPLDHLCILALKTFLKSEHTPKQLKEKKIVVSSGLVECALDDTGDDTSARVQRSYFLGAFYSDDFDTEEGMKMVLKDVHTFDAREHE